MSGLAAFWRRSGRPIDDVRLQRLAASLAHRAVDGSGSWSGEDGSISMWHGHFWTTPEDQGELQPLVVGAVTMVYDGRIDNREELCAVFGHSLAEATTFSDAALALQAFDRWGEAFVSRIKGPFAFVLWDATTRCLYGARDAFGRRSLFYRMDGDDVVIASEPAAVLGGDVLGAPLDEVFLAHLFALRSAPRGRTLFTAVHELPAGHTMRVTDGALRLERHAPGDLMSIRYRNIEEYGEHFAELLERAVLRRMRALGPLSVMMSGGLDSTSVAALAAGALAREAPGRRLSVVSYVFDDLKDLDERQWMAPMVARYNIDQTLVIADDAWPLSDFDSWRWQPSGPDTRPFRPLNERLYAAARAKGNRVLLTGSAGDSFFVSGRASWLADLVADGHWAEAIGELFRHLQRLGPRAVLRSDSARRLAAHLLGRSEKTASPPPWLTASAAAAMVAADAGEPWPTAPRLSRDARAVWESLNQSDGISTGDGEHRASVEVRDPFTDCEVVSFMLSIPAYTLYNQGTSKLVLRRAMAGALPPTLLTRPRRSDISPLFWRGVGQEGSQTTSALLARAKSFWGKYVRHEALAGQDGLTHSIQAPALVRWHCLSFGWWMIQQHIAAENGAVVG